MVRCLRHFNHLSFNFSGVKKCEIWHEFLLPLAFDTPSFQNGARYLKTKMNLVSANDWTMSSPNLDQAPGTAEIHPAFGALV